MKRAYFFKSRKIDEPCNTCVPVNKEQSARFFKINFSRIKIKFVILVSFFMCITLYTSSQTLDITIKNIKQSQKGVIRLAFFTDEESFKDEKPIFTKDYSKCNMENGEIHISISVDAGTYGISVLDDENNNDRMDYNILGIPKEGFGFSNFYSSKLRKPKFCDFSFAISTGEIKSICVKMKYFFH